MLTTRPRITSAVRRAALAGTAALLLLGAAGGPAAAQNNGHIQIHNVTTDVNDDRNEPKVGCFYIDAFGFDAGQTLDWSVWTGTPGTLGTQMAAGTATFNPSGTNTGQDISGPIKLPLGSYTAVEDDSDGRKTKVFEVDTACNNGIPMVNSKVLGITGAAAAPAVLGYVLWRRRNTRTV